MVQQYVYNDHKGKRIFGWVLLILAFFLIASLMSWQGGSSPFLGSCYGYSGNLGELFWEIFVFILIIIGAALIFHYGTIVSMSKKLSAVGDIKGLRTINNGVHKIDLTAEPKKNIEMVSFKKTVPVDDSSSSDSD